MGRSLQSSRIEVMVGDHCSIGYVENIITRRIVHCTRVADLKSIVLKRHRQLGMLVITFLGFM